MNDTQIAQVIDFVSVAKEFVTFLENSSSISSKEFVLKSRQMLPMLYLKAGFLPKLENKLEGDLENFVTPDHYEYMKNSLNEKLGSWDAMVQLEDQFAMNSEDFLHVELSELFSDIYQDIGNFILQYREGDDNVRNDAVCNCQYNFENYWGLRTLILTEHLHRIVISEEFQNMEG